MADIPNPEIRTEGEPETPNTPPQPASEPTVPQVTPTETPEQTIARLTTERDEARTKFGESSREAQVLTGKLKAYEESSRKELTTEPTDSDLQAAFPDWELMTDTEKRLARRTFATERLATSLHQKEQDREAERRWNTDLEVAIASKPELHGKEQAFKTFASKPTHRGAPLDVLVSAFLHESSPNPSPIPNPTPAPGLEAGNGGPRGPEKPKLISGEELKQLRETNYKAYVEYINTHDVSEIAG